MNGIFEMNWNIFDWIFFVTGISCVIIRFPHNQISKKTKIEKSKRDIVEQITLFITLSGCTILPILYLFTIFLNFANHPISNVLGILGAVLAFLGVWIFYLSHRDLGRQWSFSLEIRESHKLITKGIYARVRHPMYSSLFLMAVSQWLLIGNWLVAPAYFITYTILYVIRIDREEVMLIEEFGQDYVDYTKKTGRLIPLFK